MAASRKKRAKPRAKVKAKTRTGAPPGLRALDAEWRSFIDSAADEKPLTSTWPDPKGTSSRPRKQTAKKKPAKKKATKKAVKKKATKK
jgi:hypothetical protein